VIDWLASQPWSTGAAGIYGSSNTGDVGCFSWGKYDGFWRNITKAIISYTIIQLGGDQNA
jgi:hypothetical protein